jgi:AcrR family transcriptional regulator
MSQQTTEKKRKITPRKAPSQERSKQKVNQILDATKQLLVSDGLEKLTNNHIAKAAGMSVGSLYQYFPNKQAIIYRLYQDWLESVRETMRLMKQRATEVDFSTLMEELFLAVYGTPEEPQTDSEVEVELIKAMSLYSELQEIDLEHGDAMGGLLADIFLAAGLSCDEETALQLGLYTYSFDVARLEFIRMGGKPELAYKWYRQSLERAMEPYLPKK